MHMLRGSYDSNANSQFVSEQVIMFLEEDQPISDKKKKKKKSFSVQKRIVCCYNHTKFWKDSLINKGIIPISKKVHVF